MKIQKHLMLACLLAAIALLPLLPTSDFWLAQASYIGMYALVVVGLVLLTGVGGMTSFGQAAFVGIGAYTTAYLCTVHGFSPWLTLPLGLLIVGTSAWLLGLVTIRMSGHYLPLATIAWGISLFLLFEKVSWLGKYDGLTGIPPLQLHGIDLGGPTSMYYLIWAVLLCAVWLSHNLLDSRAGRAIRALKGGRTMAESMGVDTGRYQLFIFVLAALMAATSGWLFAHLQRAVSPAPFGMKMGIEYLFMAVVGGAANVWGALLGAGLLKFLEDQLQVLAPMLFGTGGNYEVIVFGILLVVLLKYARGGLWPWLCELTRSRAGPTAPVALAEAAALPLRHQPASGAAVLTVANLSKSFGGLVAVNDVSFDVKGGDIVGLIGPNGAGKSTTFNLVTGLLPPSGGSVHYQGKALTGMTPRAIASHGVARTFQHVKLLPGMSVLENVALGAHLRGRRGIGGVLRAMFRLDRADEARLLQEAARALAEVGLHGLMYEQAGSLALGQQRLLEIARALCCDPTLLLLDEPAAGLRHLEKQALADVLRKLRAGGMSILLVEHDMEFVMQLTDHIVVMEFGSMIAQGTPAAVREHPAVIAAYLGAEEPDTAASA